MCGGAVDLNKVELTNRETIIHRRSYTRIALSTAVVRLRWLYRVESIHDNYRMLFSFPFYFFPLFFFFFQRPIFATDRATMGGNIFRLAKPFHYVFTTKQWPFKLFASRLPGSVERTEAFTLYKRSFEIPVKFTRWIHLIIRV